MYGHLGSQTIPNKDVRQSRETSVTSSRSRDPSTTTTFVRGSSGRSSWRMVPHPKRQSQISNNEPTPPTTDGEYCIIDRDLNHNIYSVTVGSHETEVSEVKVELVATATETPPPPLKEHRLTQTFDDEGSSGDGDNIGDDVIMHTSSFSFTARDGKLIDSH